MSQNTVVLLGNICWRNMKKLQCSVKTLYLPCREEPLDSILNNNDNEDNDNEDNYNENNNNEPAVQRSAPLTAYSCRRVRALPKMLLIPLSPTSHTSWFRSETDIACRAVLERKLTKSSVRHHGNKGSSVYWVRAGADMSAKEGPHVLLL